MKRTFTAIFTVLALVLGPGLSVSAEEPLQTYDPVEQSRIYGFEPMFSPQPLYIGQTLHGGRGGGWPWPLPTLTYSWLRDGEVIPNSNSEDYVVQSADAGHHLSFRVTGTNSGYNDLVSTSEPTAYIVMPDYSITGTMKVGKTLSVSVPPIAGITYKYQWYAIDSFLIPGATKATYKLADSLAGSSYINVQVSAYQGSNKVGEYMKTGDFTGPVTGGKYVPVAFRTSLSAWSMSVGAPIVGNLTGENQGATCIRTWFRDGKTRLVGTGGLNERYTPVAADVGHKIVFKVACSLFGRSGSTVKTSTSPKIVKGSLNVGQISVSGNYQIGQTLNATPGAGWDLGVTYSYQWLKDGKKISGARSATYLIPSNAVGHRISVTVTASKSGYDSASDTTSRALVG